VSGNGGPREPIAGADSHTEPRMASACDREQTLVDFSMHTIDLRMLRLRKPFAVQANARPAHRAGVSPRPPARNARA
jgi:hypothetical protein